MAKVRCSLSFKKTKNDQIPKFAGGVRDGVYGHITEFATPPMPLPEFEGLIATYNTTRDIYAQGGKGQKGAFYAAKTALITGLTTMASYVNTVANGDENIITLAAYLPTKGIKSGAPEPMQATGVQTSWGQTGVVHTTCDKQPMATGYVCIMSAGRPLPPGIHIDGDGQLYVGMSNAKPVDPEPKPKPDPSPGPDPMPVPGPSDGNNTAPASSFLTDLLASGGAIDFSSKRKKVFKNLTRGVTYYFYYSVVNASGVGSLSLPEPGWCV